MYRIRYVEAGSGAPVVLLHGYTRFLESNWVERGGIFWPLAKDHRVIALDLRGHGQSDKPHDPRAYGPETIADVVRLLDHLNIERAHLLGYRWGVASRASLPSCILSGG